MFIDVVRRAREGPHDPAPHAMSKTSMINDVIGADKCGESNCPINAGKICQSKSDSIYRCFQGNSCSESSLTLLYKSLLSKALSEAQCERQPGEHFLPQSPGPPHSVRASYEAASPASAQSALTTNQFEMYAYAGRAPAIREPYGEQCWKRMSPAPASEFRRQGQQRTDQSSSHEHFSGNCTSLPPVP